MWKIDCFPLADRKVICVDQAGRTFLFDADTRQLVTMPSLHKPKWSPFSIFVPSTDEDAEHRDGGRLYVMEKNPEFEAGSCVQHSDQFEAFVFHKPTETSFKSWHCQLLPPPPFVHDYAYSQKRCKITSYSVVGDNSSHILISAEDAGTYCLDTVSNIWSRVGEWTLPFCGKVEYVPELKLWFGLSAEDHHLAAVDLSAMDSTPQLVGSWKELEPCWGWEKSQDSQLVNLGSGRFCIARFFEAMELGGEFGNKLVEQNFVILTGVEVKLAVNDVNCSASGNSKTKLEVAMHKPQFHMSNETFIDAVF
jgi:hypothetical protein